MALKVTSPAKLSGLTGFDRAMAILRRIRDDESDGYRTPLFNDQNWMDVLAAWRKRMGVTAFQFLEDAEAPKVGPYYNRKFSEWREGLEAYFVHERVDFDLLAWERKYPELRQFVDEELSYYRQRLRLNAKLRPLTVEQGFDRARKNTNLGFPEATSNWTSANVAGYIRRAELLLSGREATLFPFIMFKRVQPGGPDRKKAKQRPVWGADHSDTFSGLPVLYPVLDSFSTLEGFEHLLGIDKLEQALQRDLPKWKFKFSLDLRQLDATFEPTLVLLGLYLLSEIVELPAFYLEQVYRYYTEGEILTPDGLWSGVHGVPSGIVYTNLMETMVLRVIARRAMAAQDVKQHSIRQNGDDGLYLTNVQLETETMEESFAYYGLVLNADKSNNDSQYCSYLQRHFVESDGWKAVMSTSRMLGRILFAERGTNPEATGLSVSDFWTLNTIAKLENCKRHPAFAEFVDFVRSGDKYGLRLNELLDKDVSIVEGYSVFGDSAYGSSGLAAFETVKVLSGFTGSRRGPRVMAKRTLREPETR